MVRGPQPASAMESQQQGVQSATWAEVAANNHSSVLNSNQANQAVGLESQQNRTQPATSNLGSGCIQQPVPYQPVKLGSGAAASGLKNSKPSISQACDDSQNGEEDESCLGLELQEELIWSNQVNCVTIPRMVKPTIHA